MLGLVFGLMASRSTFVALAFSLDVDGFDLGLATQGLGSCDLLTSLITKQTHRLIMYMTTTRDS